MEAVGFARHCHGFVWGSVLVPLKPAECFPSVEAFSIGGKGSWVKRLRSGVRASQGQSMGTFEIYNCLYALMKREETNEGMETFFLMSTEGLPQTLAPSSGMRRPSRNEETLALARSRAEMWGTACFQSGSHALWPRCSRRMQSLPSTGVSAWAWWGKE